MNKVILIGNLTRDPESSTTAGGINVCRFGIAVNRRYSGSDGTSQTDFFQIVCWRALAENCAKFLQKGRKVAVCGSLQSRSYDAQDGSKRFVTEIVADEVQFLNNKSDGDDAGYSLPDDAQAAPEKAAPAPDARKNKIEGLTPIDDADLPF